MVRVISDKTGREVGTMDSEGQVSTEDALLSSIMSNIWDMESVPSLIFPQQTGDGGIGDTAEDIPIGSWGFVDGLKIFLLYAGYYIEEG